MHLYHIYVALSYLHLKIQFIIYLLISDPKSLFFKNTKYKYNIMFQSKVANEY